jgi:hypothetical protein
MTPLDIGLGARRKPAQAIRHVLALAIVCVGSPAAAYDPPPPCPSAIVQLVSYSGAGPFTVDGTAFDSSFVDVWTAHVSFDRGLRQLAVSGNSAGRMTAAVRVVETFDVVGVPPGTPVAAEIEFRLDGSSSQNCGGSGCGVRYGGTLAVGPDSVAADATQSGPGSGTRTLAATLHLPVVFVTGTPVRAEFFLEYGSGPGAEGAQGEGTGVYRVTGLPPGVRAVACPDGDVTPVRRKSWGALKTLYR